MNARRGLILLWATASVKVVGTSLINCPQCYATSLTTTEPDHSNKCIRKAQDTKHPNLGLSVKDNEFEDFAAEGNAGCHSFICLDWNEREEDAAKVNHRKDKWDDEGLFVSVIIF
jgi:hypothetical protein